MYIILCRHSILNNMLLHVASAYTHGLMLLEILVLYNNIVSMYYSKTRQENTKNQGQHESC